MRTRKEIEADGKRPEYLILEAILDVRQMLEKHLKGKKKEKLMKKKRKSKEVA